MRTFLHIHRYTHIALIHAQHSIYITTHIMVDVQGEKIGYVPRQQQAGLKASGLSSAGMMGRRGGQEDQTLDDESARGLAEVQAADEEVDAGIANIGNTLDRLGGVASNMKEEVRR